MAGDNVTEGITLKCDLCKRCFDSEISLINHNLNHSFDPYICYVCDEIFYLETEFSNHLKCHNAKEKALHQKNIFFHNRGASLYSKCSKELVNKIRIAEQQDTSAKLASSFNLPTKDTVMSKCVESVVDKPSGMLSKKIKQTLLSVKQEFVCDKCKECFIDEQDFLNHNLNIHSQLPLYKCVVCNEEFPNKCDLVIHGQKHLLIVPVCTYKEKFNGCGVSNEMSEISPRRGCVKIRKLLQSVNESHSQNTERHPSYKQKKTSDSKINTISDVSKLVKVSSSDSSDMCIFNFQTTEFNTKFFANSSEMSKIVNSEIYKDGLNVHIKNKYQAVQKRGTKNNVCDKKGKTKNKIPVKLNNIPQHFSKKEISSFREDLNLSARNANSFNSDTSDSYCVAYNQEIKEYEVFLDTAQAIKTNISSQYIDLYTENPNLMDISSNDTRSKTAERVNVIKNFHFKRSEIQEPIQNKISNVKTVDNCNETKRAIKSGKNNVEMYLGAEDSNDTSSIVAVVYDDDSNSNMTTYEVCEVELVDTCNQSSLQNSKTDTILNDFSNFDTKNAVASIEMELCDDKSLENINEHRTKNGDSLSNSPDQTINTLQGDIVLTDVTQTEEQTFLSGLFDDQFIKENEVIIKHVSPCTRLKHHRCHICKKHYSSQLALDRHLYLHSGEKPFACNFCNKRYPRKYDLQDHLLTHTGQKPYACPVCGKCFIRKAYVDKHVLIHSDKRPYLCDVCDKRFTRKDYLIMHRLNHVDDNPFMCSTCLQTFSEREDLDAHRETHAVKISYVCALCKKHFSQKRHLERHLAVHSGERPFICNICNKKFSRKDTLIGHQKCHNKEKPFECPECTKKFYSNLSCMRHIQRHTVDKTLHGKSSELSMQIKI